MYTPFFILNLILTKFISCVLLIGSRVFTMFTDAYYHYWKYHRFKYPWIINFTSGGPGASHVYVISFQFM